MEPERLKSDRIEAALSAALDGGPTEPLFDLLDRASGMPGPRPHTDVLRAFGARIAAERGRGEDLASALLEQKKTSLYYVGVMVLCERASRKGERQALEELMERADEEKKDRRDAVLDLMTDAFTRADDSPRSADRSQGLRVLRLGLPLQIVRAAVRFSETLDWLKERLAYPRPETREVIAETIRALRKIVGEAEADRLRLEHEGSAKPPRDPSRIVKGTRKRSRGR